jgi:hypothetical protein
MGKWYEPSTFTSWVGMTYNRVGNAKKKTTKEQYQTLLDALRLDFINTLNKGNIQPAMMKYIKNYPERVGERVADWYRESSVTA